MKSRYAARFSLIMLMVVTAISAGLSTVFVSSAEGWKVLFPALIVSAFTVWFLLQLGDTLQRLTDSARIYRFILDRSCKGEEVKERIIYPELLERELGGWLVFQALKGLEDKSYFNKYKDYLQRENDALASKRQGMIPSKDSSDILERLVSIEKLPTWIAMIEEEAQREGKKAVLHQVPA